VTHLARSASGVIVTNPADEAELRRRGGVKRLTQIPIGSNIAPQPPSSYDRAAWRTRMGVAPNEFLLGHFGFLNESKGGDTLIGALSALVSRKAKVKLALIGGQTGTSDAASNEAFSAEIEKLIARYDLSDRILRTGFVDAPEVSAHLMACDAVVLPYRDGVHFGAEFHGRTRAQLPRITTRLRRSGTARWRERRLVPPGRPPPLCSP
jgi:glycosyltransferase involved in cell wall biosynthesis